MNGLNSTEWQEVRRALFTDSVKVMQVDTGDWVVLGVNDTMIAAFGNDFVQRCRQRARDRQADKLDVQGLNRALCAVIADRFLKATNHRLECRCDICEASQK